MKKDDFPAIGDKRGVGAEGWSPRSWLGTGMGLFWGMTFLQGFFLTALGLAQHRAQLPASRALLTRRKAAGQQRVTTSQSLGKEVTHSGGGLLPQEILVPGLPLAPDCCVHPLTIPIWHGHMCPGWHAYLTSSTPTQPALHKLSPVVL